LNHLKGAAQVKPCPSCQRSLADNAPLCPHCGHKFATPGGVGGSSALTIIGGILGFILISLLLMMYLMNGGL